MSSIFEEIFENSPVAKILVDENSKIELINSHAEKLFQYSRLELIGKDVSILVPEEIRGSHPNLVRDYFSSPLQRQMGVGRNLFGVKKDGTKFPVEIGLTPLDTGDKLLVMSSVIDITERTRAEERFKAAFDAAPSGMIMINGSGEIVLLNKETEKIFGYSRRELINKPIESLVPDNLHSSHPAFVESYRQNPEPRAMGAGRELFGKHHSGELIPIEIGLQPVYYEDEIFVISSIVDISRRRKAEKEIQAKSEEIKSFSYRTSHDLKSPLLTAGGILDFIIEDAQEGNLDEVISGSLKAKSLITKLVHLVEDILALTKVDVDGERLSDFDFDQYLNDVKEKTDYSLNENNVALESSFEHKSNLLTQNTRLTQILDNLISNAAKYSDEQKSKRYVRISTFNDEKKFYIQIADNGIGIPIQQQSSVFSMFQRFHPEKADGSGLGLYMIKKHIDKLDAKISFESSGDGTTFYIELLRKGSVREGLE